MTTDAETVRIDNLPPGYGVALLAPILVSFEHLKHGGVIAGIHSDPPVAMSGDDEADALEALRHWAPDTFKDLESEDWERLGSGPRAQLTTLRRYMCKQLTSRDLTKLQEMPADENRIKEACRLMGVTQAAAAGAIGIKPSQLSDIAHGRYADIRLSTAKRIARFFGCAVEDLF